MNPDKLLEWAESLEHGYRMGILQPMLDVADAMRTEADKLTAPPEKKPAKGAA